MFHFSGFNVLIDFAIVNAAFDGYRHYVKRMSLRVDDEMYDWLRRESKLRRRSMSLIVRQVLIAKRTGMQQQSVTARAGELVGKFSSGRKDLSSNKKYLKGFGQKRKSAT